MSTNIVQILPVDCVDFNSSRKIICLPPRVKCDNTVRDGLYLESDDQCIDNERNYIVPVGGPFQLQYNFYDFSGMVSNAWGNWIDVDINMNGITVGYAGTNRNNTFNGQNYGQNLVVNPTDEMNCFSLSTTANGLTVNSRIFKLENCSELIELEAIHDGSDCWNGVHGTVEEIAGSAFEYRPKAWLRGTTKISQLNIKDKTETLRIAPKELIPVWYAKYLINKIFAGNKVKVNGEIYDVPEIIISATSKSRYFNFAIDLTRKCNSEEDGSLC